MSVIVSGITLPLGEPAGTALAQARRRAGLPADTRAEVVKKAIDARRKPMIREVYTVALYLGDAAAERRAAERSAGRASYQTEENFIVKPGGEKLSHRPIIVGTGPAGLFAGLLLARMGYRPVLLERGASAPERCEKVAGFWEGGPFDPVTNVQFGEGGAGTFSDGKLTTRIGDPRCRLVTEIFAAHGAPERIRWQAKPHIGTDILRDVVVSIRREIESLGGTVHFHCPATDFVLRDGAVRAVRTPQGELPCEVLVLAIGHSARDSYQRLFELGASMQAKPFSCGARIEHLQRTIDQGLYGAAAGDPRLPAGEYQLSHRRDGRAVYTFCMCPGGQVVASASEAGGIVTNGMSNSRRDGVNANAALVVSVEPSDFGAHPLAGIAFQRRLEQAAYASAGSFSAPCQRVEDFLKGKRSSGFGAVQPTYRPGVHGADLGEILPGFIAERMREGIAVFDRRIAGFGGADALLTGVETRTSAPLRILRREDFLSENIAGLYPCGEGAGYAGGIMSAAADGIRVASAVIERYAPPAG